ncbi:MAG: LysM peptidoglycan-binding domain-containing protein [Verrucomicrobia bacterium]|nr:LysM peptidoglycan-binding domain-containing protein [Pseudomonadota bacterium]NBS50147.1 LysM peptidoglycan-binding domain-containing protein [Verrucomicrobiota bacterium]NBY66432.1 LysM peptidoglycan-binding domain-containing protein [Verrucomicrobiota bacterium]
MFELRHVQELRGKRGEIQAVRQRPAGGEKKEMSDELLEYSAQRNSTPATSGEAAERPAKSGGLNRLSTIFLVVLGLHVVVIVGISAYHLLRGNPETGVPTTADSTPAPVVETAKAPEPAKPTAPEVASSMPSPDDKVWQTPEAAPAEASAPVAAAPAPASAGVPTAERFHVVGKGDTLAKIAKANGVTAAAMAKANGINGTTIKLGQKLKIPENAGAGTAASATPATPTPAKAVAAAAAKQGANPTGTYQVMAGDTLAKIAKKFGTKAEALAKLNSINDPKKLKVGMKLQVPGEASAKVESPASTQPPAGPTDMAMLPKAATH